jgi:hypothetical protein
VILLITGTGTNGSTAIADESSYARTITLNGGTAISTAQDYFNNGSVYFDKVSSQHIKATTEAGTELGTVDFTIEFFCYCAEDLIQGMLSIQSSAAGGILLGRGFDGTRLVFKFGGVDRVTSGAGTFAKNTWHFVSLQRTGSSFELWLNGSSVGTYSSATAVVDSSTYVGVEQSASDGLPNYGNYFKGYIEQLRITKNQLRSTTVPTAAFPIG